MTVKCPRCGDPAPERYNERRCRTCARAKQAANERMAAATVRGWQDARAAGRPLPPDLTPEERKHAYGVAFRQRVEEILAETPDGPRPYKPRRKRPGFATPELIAQIAELMREAEPAMPAATGEVRPRHFTDVQWSERQRRAEIQSRWQPATAEYLREIHARVAAGRGKTQQV